uniref:N-acetylmuramoyl-L-alanine amidase n=1 Tax=candidate division WOR-3 bacterium TaxID=2052148 RepID=A0A7C6EEM5_UNCW3
MRKVKYLIIHHGEWKDTPEFQTNEVKKDQMQRGYSDIAYDFVIENFAGQYFAIVGRPLTQVGGHCKGWNQVSIGICFLGNFNQAPPPIAMLRYGIEYLIIPLIQIFSIPIKNILGHGEVRDTDCPGKFFNMNQFRSMIQDNR